MNDTPAIRPARGEELEALLAMQRRSLRAGGAEAVDRGLMEAALAQMGTMDPRLIGDGTYFVAEAAGRIVGSGGWTRRPPTYLGLVRGGLPPLPGRLAAMRSVYIDPDFTRLGIARRLLAAVEAQMVAEDIEAAELLTPPHAVLLYAAMGFRPVSDHIVDLAGGFEFPMRRMVHDLTGPQVRIGPPHLTPSAVSPSATAS